MPGAGGGNQGIQTKAKKKYEISMTNDILEMKETQLDDFGNSRIVTEKGNLTEDDDDISILDRLAGFFASNATEYYGCDPNPSTYKQYMKQIEEYSKFFPNKKVKIYNCGAENLPYDELPDIDCAFTSPPYFSTEEYNKGGELEENQSWFKFNEYEKWRDDFYLPVAEKPLSKSKFMLVNIMDPKVKNVRYRSSDELINSNRDKFLGQIGMVIMQRPQGNAKFKTKEELNKFMAMKYIENVWCFGPKDYDFFSSSRRATLESFL